MSIRNTFKLSCAALALLTAGLMATSANAHFIGVVGNNSIDGSLCVGNDCIAEEAFGFDTIRLKENNLRIHFIDTSNTSSFPTRDWEITINDSSNGGAEYFAISDKSAGFIPFRVYGNARANALVVDAQGDVGIGTATPALDIDIKTGDTPSIRLQQDGTSGFTPQSWDLAGNETNFFIRDATGGSQLPFRIRAGASSNSIYIDPDDNVGLGTASPDAHLHVQGPGTQLVDYESTDGGAVQFRLRSDSGNRRMVALDNSDVVQTQIRMNTTSVDVLGPTGADIWATINASGIETMGPTCGVPCDGVFEPDFALPSIEEHASLMYKNKYLPAVGPTLPNEPINISDKMGRMLNELEKAHIYIAQQEQEINRLKALEARIVELEKQLQ